MRLHKIKLAGFKSFVEPTSIAFPSNRTGIIGPNGCGKSNVIDAIRWVMGESSAKQLRGDSMDDVIFNGSSARPPVSRASVDLIFDNSEHSLGGQYANYNEISVRREVTREGQSQYFLNGTRCRRRDIADIFLGTGLGPRSYAIIEQGMISRIIEAKPEELRVYLEEAAGITKYKERRRETENRIRHTRENLDRLDDLREEVEKQLNHLKRQADAAQRYKKLKAEERRLKAELLALRWQALNEQVQTEQTAIQEQQTQVEAVLAEQRSVELSIEQQREAHTEANESLSGIQAEYYRLGSEISRSEQSIQHHKDTRERQKQDLDKINGAWQELQQHVEEDKAKLVDVSQSIADKQPVLDSLHDNQHHSSVRLSEAEEAMLGWQQRWETFNQQESAATQKVQVEQTRLEQLKEHLERLEQRFAKYTEEHNGLSDASLKNQLEDLLQDESRLGDEVAQHQQAIQQSNDSITAARESIETFSGRLNDSQSEAQELRGKLASLEALQEAALNKNKEGVVKWLEKQQLEKQPRLAECMKVEPGWELAVETVMQDCLEAVCIDGLDAVAAVLPQLEQGFVMLVDQADAAVAGTDTKSEYLADKVNSGMSVQPFLEGIYAVDHLDQALAMRGRLASKESVITREGIWLGPNWIRVSGKAREQGSVLAREQEIQQTRTQLGTLEQAIESLQQEFADNKQLLITQEERRQQLQEKLQTLSSRHADSRAEVNSIKLQLEQLEKRRSELTHEIKEIERQSEQDRQARQQSLENLRVAESQVAENADSRLHLQEERERLNNALQGAREHAQSDKDALHEVALSLESMRSVQSSTDRNLARMQQQLDHLGSRRQELETALAQGDEPIKAKEEELAGLLEKNIIVDKSLGEARAKVELIDKEIRELESKRQAFEEQVQTMRNGLEQLRLAAQEIRVRCQTIKEQLEETEFNQEILFKEMPDEADVDSWSTRVEKLEQRVQRMGAINLAAIDEHKEQSERKEYLDAQHQDLIEALETLERAINKIDRETRARFKEVFDKVNGHMGEMFPRLFGGGQAHLEMTGDDLLSTGVAIMARPPGKRITNIHLLSGGEKALTAVAMVFAIFQLNPAPFCLLDEVDAPLDEANVSRFGQMVKEMSEKVQFIVITHNKTTMEMVDQLTGVTMREAGVSRIVAVDVDEAVKLATA